MTIRSLKSLLCVTLEKHRRLTSLVAVALMGLLTTACEPPQAATDGTRGVQQSALGEEVNLNPTAWWWYYGQTPGQVEALINSKNARLVSLQVESTSPLSFTVAMVQNSGSYAKTWWWYYGQTADELAALVQRLGARIASLQPYEVNGTTYFAAILLSNTGADAKAWWWYYGVTPEQIGALVQQNRARLVDLRQYTVGGVTRYAVVMIANTDSDATAWWWYYNVSPAQVAQFLQQNGAYLISIQPANGSSSAFNVIMNQNPGDVTWWWYYGYDAAHVAALVSQDGARIVDVNTYFENGLRKFAVIFFKN
jgi:hypothetical protein